MSYLKLPHTAWLRIGQIGGRVSKQHDVSIIYSMFGRRYLSCSATLLIYPTSHNVPALNSCYPMNAVLLFNPRLLSVDNSRERKVGGRRGRDKGYARQYV
jgi:hypothetical protein